MHLVRDIKDVNRFRQILYVFLKNGFGYLIHKAELKSHIPIHKRIGKDFHTKIFTPERLRKTFEELGGSFVKLGQLLSLRPDLIPLEYCQELSKLQDSVKPMSFSQVKRIIEKELKKPLHKVYSDFNKQPIGSASIAQVHKAKLLNGDVVAVKVQRPNLESLFQTDIDLMYKLARLIEKKEQFKSLHPVGIVNEFEDYTKKELSFAREASNIDSCYKHFKNFKNAIIPKVSFAYSTDKLITMSFIEGTKLSNIGNRFDKKGIARNLIAVYLKQTLEDGFFHADLHPGNILVLKHSKVALLDFGIFGAWDESIRDYSLDFIIGIVEEDSDKIVKVMKGISKSTGDVDLSGFENEVNNLITGWSAKKLNTSLFSTMLIKLVQVAGDYGLTVPPEMVLFAKGLLSIEGTCLELYPDLNFVKEVEPYIIKAIEERKSPKSVIKKFIKASLQWEHLAEKLPDAASKLIEKLDQGNIKLGFEMDHAEWGGLRKTIDQ